MGYRLVAVSGKFGGNRRLPTGKVNPGREATAAAGVSIEGEAHAVTRVGRRSADLLVRWKASQPAIWGKAQPMGHTWLLLDRRRHRVRIGFWIPIGSTNDSINNMSFGPKD